MLEFRLLEEQDLASVETWLKKDHVRKWYEIPHLGITIDDWIAEIKEYRGKFKWITYLIALWNQKPIGLCLYYKCTDSIGEQYGSLNLSGSYGIDYLIGEEAFLGKGLGKVMIRSLVEKIFLLPDAMRVTADIDRANEASEKSLLSCGFKLLDINGTRYVIEKKSLFKEE